MAIKSGFFTAVGGDRAYDANDINRFLEGLITDGVFDNVGDTFLVEAFGGSMDLVVNTGKAWYLNTYLYNTSTAFVTIPASDPTLPRWDRVVLDFDLNARANTLAVVQGTPASSPTKPALMDAATKKQVVIADVYVGAGVGSISGSNIYGTVGSATTPYVKGLPSNIDPSEIFTQWENEYDAWLATQETELADLEPLGVIDDLIEIRQKQAVKNLIINGDFQVAERNPLKNYQDRDSWLADPYCGIDRWQMVVAKETDGTWHMTRTKKDDGRWALRVEPNIVGTYSDFYTKVCVQTFLESSTLQDIQKGLATAKEMVLSFSFQTNVAATYGVDITHMVDNVATYITSFRFIHSGNDVMQNYEWVVPAHTTGTLMGNDIKAGLRVNFWLVSGLGYRTAGANPNIGVWGAYNSTEQCVGLEDANAIGNNTNNYVELSNVQLHVGGIGAPFRTIPYNEQLAACRRYCESYDAYVIAGEGVLNEKVYRALLTFRERKRDSPKVSVYAADAIEHLNDIDGVYLYPATIKKINPDPSWGYQYVDGLEQAILEINSQKVFGSTEYPWMVMGFLIIDSDYTIN